MFTMWDAELFFIVRVILRQIKINGGKCVMSRDESSLVTILGWLFLRKGRRLESQWPMVTGSSAFVQTKLTRPCLGFEPVTPQTWSEHLTALPNPLTQKKIVS